MTETRLNCAQCDESISAKALKCPHCRTKTQHAWDEEAREEIESEVRDRAKRTSKGQIWNEKSKLWRDPAEERKRIKTDLLAITAFIAFCLIFIFIGYLAIIYLRDVVGW